MKKSMQYILLFMISMSANATSVNFDRFVINPGQKSKIEQFVQSENDTMELGLIFQVGVTGKYAGTYDSVPTIDQGAQVALNKVSLFNVQTQEKVEWQNQIVDSSNGLWGMWEAILDPGTYSILVDIESHASEYFITAEVSQVPIPAAVYMMGAGIIVLNRFCFNQKLKEKV